MSHARRIIRESSCARSTEREDQAVKHIHPAEQQQNHLDRRHSEIHPVEDPRRRHGLGHQLILLRPRHLSPHQIHGIPLIQRREHHHEYQHPHTADPMSEAPPEQHSLGQRLNICQNRRPCGREA